MALRYFLKEIKSFAVNELQKGFDNNDNKGMSYSGIISIGELYNISYSNQRTHFYTKDELVLRKASKKQDIFSIEGDEGYEEGDWEEVKNTNLSFQRRESRSRLKKIAEYLEEDNNFFPNTVIISLNNEQYYTGIKERLFIKDTNVFSDFIEFIGGTQVLSEDDNGYEIDFVNFAIKLCKVGGDKLFLPIFELINDPENMKELDSFFLKGGEYEDIKGEDIEIKKQELKFYKIAWIVDGQHRVFASRYIKNSSALGKKVPFTCLLDVSVEKQAEIFITVNNTAKPVDKSLTYDLLPLTDEEKTVEMACKFIYDKFTSSENSPFKGILLSLKGDKQEGVLSQANFINELRPYLGENGTFYGQFQKEDLTPIYWLIHKFFTIINNTYKEAFINGKYQDDNFSLYRTTGFGAFIQIFVALVITYINIDKDFEIDAVKKDEGYSGIEAYFETSIRTIKQNLDFSRTQISRFRGKAGQRELANLMKYHLGIADDLSESDMEKVKGHLDGKKVDNTKLTSYDLNLDLKKSIEANLIKKINIKFTFIDALNYGIKIGEEKHFNDIVKTIISGLERGEFYIKSKGKTPYDTLSAVLTHDYKDNFEKLGGFRFKRIK